MKWRSGLPADTCSRRDLPSGLPVLAASGPSVSMSRPTASGATPPAYRTIPAVSWSPSRRASRWMPRKSSDRTVSAALTSQAMTSPDGAVVDLPSTMWLICRTGSGHLADRCMAVRHAAALPTSSADALAQSALTYCDGLVHGRLHACQQCANAGSGGGQSGRANEHRQQATSGDVQRASPQVNALPGDARLRPATGWS
jgi:hypothetical protein